MYELFPLVAGVLAALAVQRLLAPQFRTFTLTILGIVLGTLASAISGELFVSWAYLAFDIAQVLIAVGATVALTALWRRRPERLR